MPSHGLSDDTLNHRVRVWRDHGRNISASARELGISRSAFQSTLDTAKERGFLTGEDAVARQGFYIASLSTRYDSSGAIVSRSVSEKPEGAEYAPPPDHAIKGVSTLLGADGAVRAQWIKTRAGALGSGLVEALQDAFTAFDGVSPCHPAPETQAGRMTFYPVTDLHIGMMAWAVETGQDWDLKIAGKELRRAYDELIGDGPLGSSEAVIAFMGDILHQNDATNETPAHKHKLDVDGRYPKVLRAATELALHIIGRAAQRHAKVTVYVVPGNHDPEAAVALHLALSMFYRGNDRVRVSGEATGIHYHRFGANLIGIAHGDKIGPQRMLHAMTADRPKDWGETTCRRFYSGHRHQAKLETVGPLRCEIFAAPCAKDAFAYNGGFRAEREIVAIHFDELAGEAGRKTMVLHER